MTVEGASYFLKPQDAAEIIGVDAARLSFWAEQNIGPPVSYLEGSARYDTKKLRNWLRGGRPEPAQQKDDAWEETPHASYVPFGKCKPARISLRALRIAGVYFLCSGEKVRYVGQSLSVIPRLCEHVKTYGEQTTDAYILRAQIDELDDLEGFYIKLLRPEWNGNPGPFSTLVSGSHSANRLFAGKARSQTDRWRRVPA